MILILQELWAKIKLNCAAWLSGLYLLPFMQFSVPHATFEEGQEVSRIEVTALKQHLLPESYAYG